MDADRQKILSYTTEKFLREGFYKTTMDDIAFNLRVSKKTIYKHFPTKDKLVEEVVFNFMNSVKDMIGEISLSKKDAVSKVVRLIELLGRIISKFSENWLRDLQLHMPVLWEKIDSFRAKKMTAEVTNLIDQGKREKLFLDYPIEIIVTMFVASIRSVVNPDFLLNNKFSYDQAAKICIEILFNGILTEKGKKIFYKSFPIKVE